MISEIKIGCEDLCLMAKQPLLVIRELVPVLDHRRLGSQLGAWRDDSCLELPGEGLLAHFIPPLVELPLPLGDPLLRDMVRRVHRARRKVDE